MRDDDKRPPLRGAVHTESEWQTHIQERICQDTRGMRGKARRADQNYESRNSSRKEKSETVIAKGAPTNGRPSKFASEEAKKSNLDISCFCFRSASFRCF